MAAHREPLVRIELDLDATHDPLYGDLEGRHFHGYDCYCYLPLYIFCGRHLLAAKLRPSSADAADGSVEEVARIVGQIRERWPTTSIEDPRRQRLLRQQAREGEPGADGGGEV